MTELSLAAQRILVQDPALLATGLVGFDDVWDQGWVFPEVPGARIENSQKCAIVVREVEPWSEQNPHNRAEFGTLVFDIWGDPTRGTDKVMRFDDAKDKIKAVADVVMRNFHLVHSAVASSDPAYMGAVGMPRIWGTAEQVAERTGLVVISSQHSSGPRWAPMVNNLGGWRGEYRFNVSYC